MRLRQSECNVRNICNNNRIGFQATTFPGVIRPGYGETPHVIAIDLRKAGAVVTGILSIVN
jgi:hypothetical protein